MTKSARKDARRRGQHGMDDLDWRGVKRRMVKIRVVLSTCYVAEGFAFEDDGTVAKVIDYCDRRAAGKVGRSPKIEWAIIKFASRWGQELDWIFSGDVKLMLCHGAAEEHRRQSGQRAGS